MINRKSKVKPFGAMLRTGSVGSNLSRLYRSILHDLGIDPSRYDALMTRYIQKAHLDPNRKDKATARAGLSKELLKETMTWKTFVKGLNFLAVVKFDLNISLHHANGKITNHKLSVAMDDMDVEESQEKSDE